METKKDMPSAERREIMWRVAVSEAIERAEPAHEIYTTLLYNYMTGSGPQIPDPEED